MTQDTVKLLGFWVSPYTLRVKWALSLKGIQYEYVEEDHSNKSSLLLQCNPVHKKVPVLVHNSKPIVESLVIIEYIDETWKNHPLLPKDPSERARFRFWAKFVEDKCCPAMFATLMSTEDQRANAAKVVQENFKTLQSSLRPGKLFFGGERLGFLDIAIAWIGIWAKMIEEVVDVKLLDDDNTPLLNAWFRDVLEVTIVKECIPPLDKLVAHNKDFRKRFMAAKT